MPDSCGCVHHRLPGYGIPTARLHEFEIRLDREQPVLRLFHRLHVSPAMPITRKAIV
jgi:hypothetical protein